MLIQLNFNLSSSLSSLAYHSGGWPVVGLVFAERVQSHKDILVTTCETAIKNQMVVFASTTDDSSSSSDSKDDKKQK